MVNVKMHSSKMEMSCLCDVALSLCQGNKEGAGGGGWGGRGWGQGGGGGLSAGRVLTLRVRLDGRPAEVR